MKGTRQTIEFLVVCLLSGTTGIVGADEPPGLVLRKGTIAWKATLQQARNVIEEDMRPATSEASRILEQLAKRPRSEQDRDDNKFGCRRLDSIDVLRCHLACCVDFGEEKTLRFATLYFKNDRFYRYDIAFPLALYKKVETATKQKYGKPTSTEENPLMNLRGDRFSTIVEQWRRGNTLLVLGSRGGEGKIFLSYIEAYYLPIARQVAESEPKVKLPF
jgi:hypothetical protein